MSQNFNSLTTSKVYTFSIHLVDSRRPGCVHAYLALVVGAGEGRGICSSTGWLQPARGLGTGAVLLPLQHLHQISYEKIVLQCCNTLFRQDGGLSAHRAGEGQGLRGDVVLEASVMKRVWKKMQAVKISLQGQMDCKCTGRILRLVVCLCSIFQSH